MIASLLAKPLYVVLRWWWLNVAYIFLREWSEWLEYRWLSHFRLSPCSQVTHFKSLVTSRVGAVVIVIHAFPRNLKDLTFEDADLQATQDSKTDWFDQSWLFMAFLCSFQLIIQYNSVELILNRFEFAYFTETRFSCYQPPSPKSIIVFIIDHGVDCQSTSQGYGGSARRVWPD